jgi:hypothetical protein
LIKIPEFPRSTNTESVYGRLLPYPASYTTVYMAYTLRIRPYFAVLHVTVLRSYISVTVYGAIRRNTATVYGAFTVVNDRIFPVYGRKRASFGKLQYIDHGFMPFYTIPSRDGTDLRANLIKWLAIGRSIDWHHKPFYQTGQ